ncbi:hypothetical protein C453_02389 [Haloferax elongans ATCC BAA-1513]|uniref:Uncharacterized protein n=1 Tax=Haloferax elongans ATCC BAA-1513 TaxID=1230453 RepID=M0HTZ9_HALEO|nr:hypothetical protein [Haloferax elongans]ELZ87162.1 hypothetical protein C453_02389 [Haloferax elongans ATCC BAA-1513]
MGLTIERRSTAGLLAICCGLISTLVAVEVVGGDLSLEGMPIVYSLLGLSVVGTAVTSWYGTTDSWKSVLLYAVLTFGSSFTLFVYLFARTTA